MLTEFFNPLPTAVLPGIANALTSASTATLHPLPGAELDGLGMLQLALHASLPVRLIMALLVVASLSSWAIIFHKRRAISRAQNEANYFEERFLHESEALATEMAAFDDKRVTGMEAIYGAGLREFVRFRKLDGSDSRLQLDGVQLAMRATGSRQIDELEGNLEFLANIGSTAPYIGLVGTVFGIMVTMHGLLASGTQVGIRDVAPGISEALLATAMGLFVAIPAVWAYNRFASSVERLSVRYSAFAEEFSSVLQRRAHLDE